MQKRLASDDVGSKAALIEILVAVQCSLGAECLRPLKTFNAVVTAVDLVASAYAITFLQGVTVRSHGLDNVDIFVIENHVCRLLLPR